MWRCLGGGFGPGGGFMGGGLLGMLILIIIVVLAGVLIAKLVQGTQANKTGAPDRDDSLAILKARYAKGEISDEEFQRMKRVLS